MVILLTAIEQSLFRSQNRDLRKAAFQLIRDIIVIPLPSASSGKSSGGGAGNVPQPGAASRTVRLPEGPMGKLVNLLIHLFHDHDDAVRLSALETLKFYMQCDNEVVYSHMEDITVAALLALQQHPLADKRNATTVDFLVSLTEILRNQMRSQRTDQLIEPHGQNVPPVFSLARFITLMEKGLALAAERKSDAICATLVGKFLGLIDGSEDANILTDFHRLIGPLLELVKHKETCNPVNVYLVQQHKNVDVWVNSPAASMPAPRPHQQHVDPKELPSASSSGDQHAHSGSAAAPAAATGNITTTKPQNSAAAAAIAAAGEFNRVAAIDSVISRFLTLHPTTCSAYSTALHTFLSWLVLLLTFKDPLAIPMECGAQIGHILAPILNLDAGRTHALHEKLEAVFRRWPSIETPPGAINPQQQILDSCLKTFNIPERRNTTLLKWVGHVIALCYPVASERRVEINSRLLQCMGDTKEVHLLALQLLCRLAKTDKKLWDEFLGQVVETMSEFKARIPTCFCTLQQFSFEIGFEPSFLIVSAARHIQKGRIIVTAADGGEHQQRQFRGAIVKTLSLLICTAMEFDPLRRLLREGTARNDEARNTFEALFPCWCFNAAWSVGLCLLTREFALANALVEEIASGDVTAFVLEQLHRVVQLFDSPCFAFARVALLRPRQNPDLVRTLFGVLMLLPQESAAFGQLQQRLECVSQQQQALAGVEEAAYVAPSALSGSAASSSSSSAKVNVQELNRSVETFRKMQALLEQEEMESASRQGF